DPAAVVVRPAKAAPGPLANARALFKSSSTRCSNSARSAADRSPSVAGGGPGAAGRPDIANGVAATAARACRTGLSSCSSRRSSRLPQPRPPRASPSSSPRPPAARRPRPPIEEDARVVGPELDAETLRRHVGDPEQKLLTAHEIAAPHEGRRFGRGRKSERFGEVGLPQRAGAIPALLGERGGEA